MTDRSIQQGLLPEGLRDSLPPAAGHREDVVRRLLDVFKTNGYEYVQPPLLEFEAGLRGRLDDGQGGHASNAFRLLDPESQRTLVVRSDITRQVARVAATRMPVHPRPLRLCYSGSALKTKGTQLHPSRQLRQVGFELIGPSGSRAAQELGFVVHSGFDALTLPGLTFDLAFPRFIPQLCDDYGLGGAQKQRLTEAFDDKDAGALSSLPEPARTVFHGILKATGRADKAIASIAALSLPEKSQAVWGQAVAIIDVFVKQVGASALHVDPGEFHGFSYQSDWALSVFSQHLQGELGRGGAYMLKGGEGQELGQGFTFYPDVFADSVSKGDAKPRLFIPFGTDFEAIKPLQKQGFVTVLGMSKHEDVRREARHQGCTYILQGDKPEALLPAPAADE